LTLAGLAMLNPTDYENMKNKKGESVFQFVSYGSPIANEVMEEKVLYFITKTRKY